MTIAIHPRIEEARPQRRASFPRLPLYSAFALVAFAFVTIIFSQATGIGSMITDPGQPVDMIDLTISQAEGDLVRVSEANSGSDSCGICAIGRRIRARIDEGSCANENDSRC